MPLNSPIEESHESGSKTRVYYSLCFLQSLASFAFDHCSFFSETGFRFSIFTKRLQRELKYLASGSSKYSVPANLPDSNNQPKTIGGYCGWITGAQEIYHLIMSEVKPRQHFRPFPNPPSYRLPCSWSTIVGSTGWRESWGRCESIPAAVRGSVTDSEFELRPPPARASRAAAFSRPCQPSSSKKNPSLGGSLSPGYQGQPLLHDTHPPPFPLPPPSAYP